MRMPRKVEADRDEMVRIFRGWYEKGNLHTLRTEQAVKRLVEVIRSDAVYFPRLAHDLQKAVDTDSVHADHGGFVSNHPMDEYAEKARKVIGEPAWEFMMGAVDVIEGYGVYGICPGPTPTIYVRYTMNHQ